VTEGPAIVFDRVSKSFTRPDGEPFEAVRNLSFSIARGELVAILGKTGCGKSTTFNLIAGLLRRVRLVPRQGRHRFSERPADALAQRDRQCRARARAQQGRA
jgi:ABC-type glutathione transport system ATPase component